jgi:hypothetical protein
MVGSMPGDLSHSGELKQLFRNFCEASTPGGIETRAPPLLQFMPLHLPYN